MRQLKAAQTKESLEDTRDEEIERRSAAFKSKKHLHQYSIRLEDAEASLKSEEESEELEAARQYLKEPKRSSQLHL